MSWFVSYFGLTISQMRGISNPSSSRCLPYVTSPLLGARVSGEHSHSDSHNENISEDVIYGSPLAHRGSRKTHHGWVRQGLHELRSSFSRPLSRHHFREPSSPHLGLHDHFPRHQAYAVLVPLLRGACIPDVQLSLNRKRGQKSYHKNEPKPG